MTQLYCQALEVKFHSQVRFTQLGMLNDRDYESMIEQLVIPSSMKLIDSYCLHNFLHNVGGTVLLDGSGDRDLILPPPYLPVISVSSVKLGGAAITTDIVPYENILHYEGGVFTKVESSRKNVEIVMDYGYTAVPEDIKYACAIIGANIINAMVRRKLVPNVVTENFSTQASGFSALLNVPVALTADIKDTLDKYRYSYMAVG